MYASTSCPSASWWRRAYTSTWPRLVALPKDELPRRWSTDEPSLPGTRKRCACQGFRACRCTRATQA